MGTRYHALTVFSGNGIERILRIQVGVSEPTKNPNNKTKVNQYFAIWDTGATGSVITKKVVDDLKLFSIGQVNVNTASGQDKSNTYLINMYLPNKVLFSGLRVTEAKLIGNIEVIIGMDIISKGDFAVNSFDGYSSYSFRIPSLEYIDYTTKPIPIRQQRKEMQRQHKKRRPKPASTKK